MKRRRRGGPFKSREEEEEEECGFQEELHRRLCSNAGSRSWLPRRVFIRLQEGTRKKRKREREKSRNKGSLTEEEEEEERARDPREVQMFRKLYKCSSLRFRKLLLYCSNMCVQKMAVCTHRSQPFYRMVLFDI